MRLTALIFTFVLALSSSVYAQKVHFSPATESVILERREPVPESEKARQARIEELFRQVGCLPQQISEQKIEALPSANVICRLSGKSDHLIIVGANYGLEPPDTWNGAVLLPALYQALAAQKRRHTFLFVAFADEKRSLAGSAFFVNHMTQSEADHTDAMINLDALGFSPTKISTQHSDPALVKSLITMVYLLKLPISQVDMSRTINTDSESFVARNIPRITLHSLTLDEVIGPQKNDEAFIREFRPDNYYSSYRLICGFLAYLDEKLKSGRRK